MKRVFSLLPVLGLIFFSACQNGKSSSAVPVLVDQDATQETRALYQKLQAALEKGILFGHQDDLAYGHNWYNEPGRSDVKDICGDYPALIGWELGHLEIDAPFNLDSVHFADMKRYVQEAHRWGSVNSFSWHGDNIVTGGTSWDCQTKDVVRTILPGGANHEKYKTWLDRLASFFSGLKDEKGKLIPVIFRMYHEHTGNWFWWGSAQCTPEEYKQLWILTMEYLRDKKNVHNLLYAYSPSEVNDEAGFLERYPGDAYVDIVGFDCYAPGGSPEQIEHYKRRMDLNLQIVAEYASRTGKIPIVGETGLESVADPAYFTEVLYPVLSKYKIGSVLLWRNAWEPDKKAFHYYVPFPGHPAAEDFKRFTEKPDILMARDIRDL